jgi:hypothetical protein
VRGIRFVVGRLRSSSDRAVQSIVFDSHEWSERDARGWLDEHGFKVRALDRAGRWWRSRQREPREFDSRSFRTIDTVPREVVTMASNPKRRGKKRRAPKRRRAAASRRRKLSGSRTRTRVRKNTRRRRARAKTVRTKVTTVRVMRTNARRRRRRARSSARYTVAFAPAAAKLFGRMLRKVRRREMRRALRRHPRGGVYVALPAWHGSREQAQRLADRVRLVLTYLAGRRRASLTSSSVPRVVAVP